MTQIEEFEEILKDAARYRYLRDHAEYHGRNGPGIYWHLPRWNFAIPLGEQLDKAIDASIEWLKQI